MPYSKMNTFWMGIMIVGSLVISGSLANVRGADVVRGGTVSDASASPSPVFQDSLTDVHGQPHTLADYAAARYTVVVFLGTECPLAKLYAPRLNSLSKEFGKQGISFVGVMSNSQDSLVEIEAYARRYSFAFPLLKDLGSVVADRLGAERTPEVFVLDEAGNEHYHGRIDDQYGVGYIREAPQQEDLRLALAALADGRSVAATKTEAVGCLIGRRPAAVKDDSITYANQISRVFQQHCVECHREGEIAPFAMTDYDEIVGWAETIVEVIQDQRMPPWHANPQYGQFHNQRLMSDADKELVYKWVENGAPLGDPSDLPAPVEYSTQWRLPKEPDAVIPMRDRPFSVPAEGVVEYQYFVVDPGFTEDKWVSAAEVIPGNRSVVHHCIVFIRPPDEAGLRGFGWLGAYVPGQVPMVLPADCGRRVAAGSKLVFQMHYTPNGASAQDLTRIGLVFADPDKIQRETMTLVAINREFRIPAGAEDYRVEAAVEWLPKEGEILSLAPHMHMRGKAFRYTFERNGSSEIVLDVPTYDFNWQHVYQLSQPIPISEDLKIHCEARFNNSETNLVNPDPNIAVKWGDQTWQEMMVGFLDVAVDRNADIEMPWSNRVARGNGENGVDEQRRKDAEQFIRRFDVDGDGRVSRAEVPTEFAVFAFRRMDRNKDDAITLDEAISEDR